MTHPSPGSGAGAQPPTLLSRAMLERQIALRRMRLAELEAALIADCETAAQGASSLAPTSSNRERWDRAARRRYLDAALRVEASYGPPMRRLHRDIARLERLAMLPITG